MHAVHDRSVESHVRLDTEVAEEADMEFASEFDRTSLCMGLQWSNPTFE